MYALINEGNHYTYANHAIVANRAGRIAYTPCGKHWHLRPAGAGSTAEAGIVKFSEEVAAVRTSSLLIGSSFPDITSRDGASAVSAELLPSFWLEEGLASLSIVMVKCNGNKSAESRK